jgi:hypothetical protein
MNLKKLWKITYTDSNGQPAIKQVICQDYEKLQDYLTKRTWCMTITKIEKSQELEEVV